MASNDDKSPKSTPEEIPDSQESASLEQMPTFGSAESAPSAFTFDFKPATATKEVPRPDIEPVGRPLLLAMTLTNGRRCSSTAMKSLTAWLKRSKR
jgi:hypothetical protein